MNELTAEEKYKKGAELYRSGKYQEAFPFFESSANQGDAMGQFGLGFLYEEGLAVQQDYQKALAYYQLSAAQGNAKAQCNLGWFYEQGLAVQQNYPEAVRYYQLSADQGNADAQYNLGCLYQKGFGVQQNYREAVRYYQLSADQEDAQDNLSALFQRLCRELGTAMTDNTSETKEKLLVMLNDLYPQLHQELLCATMTDNNPKTRERLFFILGDLYQWLYPELRTAITENNLEAARKLLVVEGLIFFDNTLLHLAVEENKPEMVKLLICYGADVNAENEDGYVPRDLNPDCFDKAALELIQNTKENIEKICLFLFLAQENPCDMDIVGIILSTLNALNLQMPILFVDTYRFLKNYVQSECQLLSKSMTNFLSSASAITPEPSVENANLTEDDQKGFGIHNNS